MLFRKFGKAFAGITIISLLFVGSVVAAPLQPITHLDWMKEKSFVISDAAGNFQAEGNITLAEVVASLAKVQGKAGLSAADALAWAKGLGAITDAEASKAEQEVHADRLAEIAAKIGYTLTLNDKAEVTRVNYYEALGNAITTHITIAHTNDVHGHIVEKEGEFGYAKMATLIKQWRAENENFWLIDAGDTFQGSVYVNEYKGESIVPILNKLDYEVMAAGNHEFDFGWEQVLKLRDMLDYPMISANVFYSETGELFLQDVHYAEIAGKKFAFLGFVTEETPVVTHPNNVIGLEFKSPVEVAKQVVPELKKEVDHVIVVSHVGIDIDRKIAAAVDGIDLIVGGHSHTPVQTPELVNGTYIVQDWEYSKSLGRADLFYYNGELVNFSGGLLEYDEAVVADAEIDAMVKEISDEMESKLQVVIAKAAVNLDGDRTDVRARETNLGNLTTDIMLERTKIMPGFEADVALTNGGGIRDKAAAGDITKRTLLDIFPFPNTLVIVEATGSDIVAALENGVSQVETGGGRFPQISGMTFSYDPRLPAGERVKEVLIGSKAIDLNKTYRVATNDFIATGGDGYASFKKDHVLNSGITFYDMMEEALIAKGTVSPTTNNRIIDVSKPQSTQGAADKPAPGTVYVVKDGDVLWKIAQQYGFTYQELAAYNKLSNPHLIVVGQKLLIPAK